VNNFKISTLYHLAVLQQCLRKHNAESSLNPADFVLQLRARNRYYTLYPQFFGVKDGAMHYTPQLEEHTKGFAGWLPYFNKRWPIAASKPAFKDFCQQSGLRTPPIWRAPQAGMRDFLVKHCNGAFGNGIRGPFAAYDSRDAAQAIDEQSYYEAFVRGRIVKATYWDGRLAAVEIKTMATVAGDGKSTLRQLIAPSLSPLAPQREWQMLESIAAYEGLTLDSVPAAGRSVLVDFRFGSYVNLLERERLDPFNDLADTPLLKQLVECGPLAWQGIPEAQRAATLFTLDAVLDDQDQLWLLEMNCNPVCHPKVYPLMFETLFGAPEAVEQPAPPHASALPHPSLTLGPAMRPGAPRPGAPLIGPHTLRFS
jgi:hypothetical protein